MYKIRSEAEDRIYECDLQLQYMKNRFMEIKRCMLPAL